MSDVSRKCKFLRSLFPKGSPAKLCLELENTAITLERLDKENHDLDIEKRGLMLDAMVKEAMIKDLSLRIAVLRAWISKYKPVSDACAEWLDKVATDMPIESLHEFIKNNPQYGEKL